ncbi:hypothetical protein ALC56_00697 [Trachymyrmex septentrionalis]|uniref:Uncharacterized protein n=1 Tax=Trachymyrmex septentrionalis TaxID=34720 RepID=A0A195FWL4_9HYME|nr:hypothetical protein ALC56_00697 [Trachymyrmex septentrionalis]
MKHTCALFKGCAFMQLDGGVLALGGSKKIENMEFKLRLNPRYARVESIETNGRKGSAKSVISLESSHH